MIIQNSPLQRVGYASTLDRCGESADSLEEFLENVWNQFGTAEDYVLTSLSETPGTWGSPGINGARIVEYIRQRRVVEADAGNFWEWIIANSGGAK